MFEAGAFKGCLVSKNQNGLGTAIFLVQETLRGLGGRCPGARHGACPPSDDDPNIFNPCLGKTPAEIKYSDFHE